MTFWVFIQLIRWARCDLYYIFTVIDSYRQKNKKKQQHGSGREWESFFREWNGIFLQFFRGIWEEIKVCDAFWKQEMSPWSNAPPGLRNPFSKTYF